MDSQDQILFLLRCIDSISESINFDRLGAVTGIHPVIAQIEYDRIRNRYDELPALSFQTAREQEDSNRAVRGRVHARRVVKTESNDKVNSHSPGANPQTIDNCFIKTESSAEASPHLQKFKEQALQVKGLTFTKSVNEAKPQTTQVSQQAPGLLTIGLESYQETGAHPPTTRQQVAEDFASREELDDQLEEELRETLKLYGTSPPGKSYMTSENFSNFEDFE